MVCCVIGHSYKRDKIIPEIRRKIEPELTRLIQASVTAFEFCGRDGFDIITAFKIIAMRKRPPFKECGNIKINMVMPYPVLDAEESALLYSIIDEADNVRYINASPRSALRACHRFIINQSDICFCCINGKRKIEPYSIKYAMKKRLRIINLKLL